MDDLEFEVGDVVRLNCSSFRMTVDRVEPDAERPIVCVWLNQADDLIEAAFFPAQLVPVGRK